jgi:hypothetical protein
MLTVDTISIGTRNVLWSPRHCRRDLEQLWPVQAKEDEIDSDRAQSDFRDYKRRMIFLSTVPLRMRMRMKRNEALGQYVIGLPLVAESFKIGPELLGERSLIPNRGRCKA